MGLATFAIGLLPTYAAVGVLAPILLVTVRIIQGLAFGAEWGGAILMSYEHAPWRKKGRYTGIVQAGFPVGLLIANLVFFVSIHLGGDWAWRVPFLASIILVIVGLIIRAKVPESPVFEDVKEQGDIVKSPIVEVVKKDWRNILRGIGLRVAETAGYAVSITYMLSYLKGAELATRSADHRRAVHRGCARHLRHLRLGQAHRQDRPPPAVPLGVLTGHSVRRADVRHGEHRVCSFSSSRRSCIAYCVFQNALAGCQGGWFPELFNANTRSSGASLAYQISAMVSGFTPFITTLLFEAFGWWGPALLFSGYMAIGLVAAIVTRETWGPRERQLAEKAAAETADPHALVA